MSVVAVSPHLDDAALSASAALGRGGATVVTIFTALPPQDRPVTWWDRLTGATSSLERQRERLAELLTAADEVWLPSAIGGHRDHMLARNAGLRAAAGAGHTEVVLYADFPYVIAFGWPAWVSGQPDGGYLDAGFWLAEQLASADLDSGRLTPVVTRLSRAQRAVKAEIIAAYRTQAPALRLAPPDLAADPSKLD